MKKVGVRYCGGCNPRYDRGGVFQKIRDRLQDIDFEVAQEGVEYDALLVIGGCTSCCASYHQFTYCKGVVKIWDPNELEDTIKKLKEWMEVE
ncbi:MAG: hypothetical protein EOM59_13115 [Clostridia bacterium]|jgi:hypothetical protein|nr:hypothetical protein [Clostridia bacterium]